MNIVFCVRYSGDCVGGIWWVYWEVDHLSLYCSWMFETIKMNMKIGLEVLREDRACNVEEHCKEDIKRIWFRMNRNFN